MKFKFFNKIYLTFSAIILVCVLVTLLILSFFVSNYFSKEKYSLLQSNCASVAEIALTDMNSVNFKRNFYNIIRVQNTVSDVNVLITDTTGKIFICGCDDFLTGKHCLHIGVDVERGILNRLENNDYKSISALNGIFSEEKFVVGKAIKSADGSIHGYVFSATSAASLKTILNTMNKMFLFSLLAPLVITFFVLYAMTYKFIKPLQVMSKAAKSMAKGDFSTRIPVYGNDEIGELAVSFNNMTDSLSRLEEMRRSFIGNVSHELRTPMTTISGFIDGIIDGTIDDEHRDIYLQKVSDEVKRLSRVVKSMLDLAKLEAGEVAFNPTKFNISEQIAKIVLSREQQIEEKQLDIINLDKLPEAEVCADYDLIYQAIYNIVDNAVKFSNVGGSISFDLVVAKSSVQFSVKNTGEGIPKSSIDKIFERFYKTDKSRSANANSTGIGLYIVKTIIDIHGGKIVAESVENEYTVFKVLLPIKTEAKINGRK